MEDEFDPHAEISRAARNARTQNDIMGMDDLIQELWVFYLEQLGSGFAGRTHATQQSLLAKRARYILQQERIDYMHFSGAFVYTPDGVRTILANETWTEIEGVLDVEGRIDVQTAMKGLSIDARRLLFRQFALGERTQFTDAQKRMSERAVDKISNRLNAAARVERADPAFVNTRGELAVNQYEEDA